MSTIPIRREEITTEWLTAMLASAGECVISGLHLETMTGYNPELSQLFRVRIDYAVRTEAHPVVVIAKIPPVDGFVRLRESKFGPYASELGCYRLLEEFQGGSIARMYGAVEDLEEETASFVFEDLGVFPEGQKYARIDLDVAKSTLDFMATFHARYWRDDSLEGKSWIRDDDWAFLFNQDPLGSATGWQVIKDDDRFDKSGGLVVAGEYLGARLTDLRDAMRSRPRTLTHNDFHQGNVLLRETPIGQQPVIIDWQMPAYSGGTNDLAKFMMTAVPFEILAEHETALVARYAESLKTNGVTGYSFEECWRDYRRAQVATFGNYAISCYETSADGGLIESSGDSTHAVIKALTLADPAELKKFLP
ncbi:MAG: phosphotransferase [Chloroflexi bacterium]|jgi:hypothetical protein|nr:phosphotransferase [Chloroflexota bacterium]MBT5627228.1 phosphotransferase [Chloroflexota bacterium]